MRCGNKPDSPDWNVAPPIAAEIMIIPSRVLESKVTVTTSRMPIEFQSLDLEFGRAVLEIVARTGILSVVQKLLHRIHCHSDVDGVGLQPLRLR